MVLVDLTNLILHLNHIVETWINSENNRNIPEQRILNLEDSQKEIWEQLLRCGETKAINNVIIDNNNNHITIIKNLYVYSYHRINETTWNPCEKCQVLYFNQIKHFIDFDSNYNNPKVFDKLTQFLGWDN